MPHTAVDGVGAGGVPPRSTNLEQASDWLIKLLLGAGLTQIRDIFAGLSSLAISLATSLKQQGTLTTLGDPTFFFATLIIFFATYGFILVYFLFSRRNDQRLQLVSGADPHTG